MSKQSRKTSPYQRRPASRPLRESFLILCEGRNIEPEYFNAFRLATATVRALTVTSGDAMAVVRAAIKRRDSESEKGKQYDNYWVVFDKDDTILLSRQSQAIENSLTVLEQYVDKETRNPAVEESSTTVHELVESLRRFL